MRRVPGVGHGRRGGRAAAGRTSSRPVPPPLRRCRSARSRLRWRPRARTGVSELDRVLGGGLVPGAVVLLAGEPGIGKSTLLLEAAARIAERDTVLYVTGEESAAQVRLRADRIGAIRDRPLPRGRDRPGGPGHARGESPAQLLVVDSVQTVGSAQATGVPGGRDAGARGGRQPRPAGQGAPHGHRARRPRHQGRLDRRPAHPGAPGRRRAQLRGRPPLPAAHGPRDQEQVRSHRRGRLLRPARARHRRHHRPERPVRLPAQPTRCPAPA